MSEPALGPNRARLHEALVLKLEALLAELRPLAARHPEGKVSEPLRIAAETLLYEAMRFRERKRREKFPAAATALGALLVELGQARAGLEAFELTHSFWSAPHKAFLWRTSGAALPVARLRPPLVTADRPAAGDDKRRRRELGRLVNARIARAWDEGFAQARTGTPPAAETPAPPGLSGRSG